MAPGGGPADRGHDAGLTGPTPAAAETIFALSSGAPPAAIAVVRVSGPAAGAALRSLAGRLPLPRRATALPLRDDTGGQLDEALVLWFPGPASATGEDMVELHLHGGRATVAAVLAALGRRAGLRPAAGGEFTRRALANGRIDLAQAEALADLLAAETERQRRAALRGLEGGVGRLVGGWRARLLELAAAVEARIEFAEDLDEEEERGHALGPALAALADEIAAALRELPAERLRDGVRVVLAGPVNAGKSTLLNRLAGRDAALTSDMPGTTRDLVEVPVLLDGQAVLLIDSAGLREAENAVEQAGIARAAEAIAGADLILWLGEAADCPDRLRAILVHAQADRPDRNPPHGDEAIPVSAVTGAGIGALRARIAAKVVRLLPAETALALAEHQRAQLRVALDCLSRAITIADEVLVAEELRAAGAALGLVLGYGGTEVMLDTLFARFCIGK